MLLNAPLYASISGRLEKLNYDVIGPPFQRLFAGGRFGGHRPSPSQPPRQGWPVLRAMQVTSSPGGCVPRNHGLEESDRTGHGVRAETAERLVRPDRGRLSAAGLGGRAVARESNVSENEHSARLQRRFDGGKIKSRRTLSAFHR